MAGLRRLKDETTRRKCRERLWFKVVAREELGILQKLQEEPQQRLGGDKNNIIFLLLLACAGSIMTAVLESN
jgi:hypothetical protein